MMMMTGSELIETEQTRKRCFITEEEAFDRTDLTNVGSERVSSELVVHGVCTLYPCRTH